MNNTLVFKNTDKVTTRKRSVSKKSANSNNSRNRKHSTSKSKTRSISGGSKKATMKKLTKKKHKFELSTDVIDSKVPGLYYGKGPNNSSDRSLKRTPR